MDKGLSRRIESAQDEYQSHFKQKADVLLLKKKLKSRVEWPAKVYRQTYQNSVLTKKIKERNIYTNTNEKSVAKVNAIKHRHFKRTAWDPLLNNKTGIWSLKTEKSELDESNENDLIDFVKASKPSFDNKIEANIIEDQDTELIKDLSLQLLDQVINNIANPLEKDTDQQKKELNWEFMLANVLQTGLPSAVVDRVERHMALVTGKKTAAINALNVTPCQLSDLTIPDTEMEMRIAVQEMREKTENESLELLPDGDYREDLTWLIDLSRKDKQHQHLEIEKINSDYSNRVLNSKSAFF